MDRPHYKPFIRNSLWNQEQHNKFAMAALTGILARPITNPFTSMNEVVKLAANYADLMMIEMDKE
jgi:hypothetical protein